jgi:nucleotide-binding universal stress UspA family protein
MNANTVVAAVDFSAASNQILMHAARYAGYSGASLVIAHAVPTGRMRDWEQTMGHSYEMSQGLAEVDSRLREMARAIPGAAGARIVVRVGDPFRTLEALLRETGGGLLVLGAHDVARHRLGSVSARCARAAPADILIIRDWQTAGFRRIAACVDFSASSATALDRAVSFAACHRCPLEIIHVLYPPDRDPWGRVIDPPPEGEGDYGAMIRTRVEKRLERFLEPYHDRMSGITWNTHLIEGESPAAAVTARIAAQGFDLAVIGSHEGSWIEDVVLGSNAARILHDSESSVLIARG